MKFMEGKNAVAGGLGSAYATIDGNKEEMFYAKNVSASVEKKKSEIAIMGKTGRHHKSGGWVGKGKMTIYYVTSLYRKTLEKYAKTGVDTYFDMIVTNDDPDSDFGRQTVLLKGVNLDSVVLAILDSDKVELDEEVPFTFNDFDILEEFVQ